MDMLFQLSILEMRVEEDRVYAVDLDFQLSILEMQSVTVR